MWGIDFDKHVFLTLYINQQNFAETHNYVLNFVKKKGPNYSYCISIFGKNNLNFEEKNCFVLVVTYFNNENKDQAVFYLIFF